MDIINTLFTGAAAIVVGVILGFIIAGIIGLIVWGLVVLRDRMKKNEE